jgi:hypothetical protein
MFVPGRAETAKPAGSKGHFTDLGEMSSGRVWMRTELKDVQDMCGLRRPGTCRGRASGDALASRARASRVVSGGDGFVGKGFHGKGKGVKGYVDR